MTQEQALRTLQMGGNVFLTGEPGAGKSHTVREYMKWLNAHHILTALTASTGIAATHIGGVTVHSWSGLGIRKHVSGADCRELAGNAKVAKRVREARVLVIDEISMLDAAALNAVDAICRSLRGSGESFGGMQVVLVGDFFQLPPVSRPEEEPSAFAFTSAAWQQARLQVCYLHEQHRQEDARFLRVLSALRGGHIDEEHVACLQERCVEPSAHEELTKLYAHNADVDALNERHLKTLLQKERAFSMESHGDKRIVEAMKRSCLSPEHLVLKVGARVMCTRNNPSKGYVNGSMGEVVSFDADTGFPVVRLRSGRKVLVEREVWSADVNGESLAAIRQVPLRLAWAITIHKSQGMSLDSAYMDLRQAFAYGQGYVALSRVRTLAGLFLAGLNARALEVDPLVLAEDARFRDASLAGERALDACSLEQSAAREQAFITRCGGVVEGRVSADETPVDTSGDAWARGAKPKKHKEPKWAPTLALLVEGHGLAEVATKRARTMGTIIGHVAEAHALGKIPTEVFTRIQRDAQSLTAQVHPVMEQEGHEFLGPIHSRFGGHYSYDDLRLAQWLFVVGKGEVLPITS